MKPDLPQWNDPSFDEVFFRWLGGEFTTIELEEWCQYLLKDAAFREKFCDWVKMLRDPGMAHHSQKKANC